VTRKDQPKEMDGFDIGMAAGWEESPQEGPWCRDRRV